MSGGERTLFEHCYGQTWKWNFPLVSYNSRFSKSFVCLLVVLLGLFAWYSFWTSILNISVSSLVTFVWMIYPKEEKKWLGRIQGTDDKKKRYVSPFLFHHTFLKLLYSYLTHILQIYILYVLVTYLTKILLKTTLRHKTYIKTLWKRS